MKHEPRPVWVDLRVLFPTTDAKPPGERAGDLVLTDREVRGQLHRWWEGHRGLWLGVVDFDVEHVSGRVQRFEGQLLPEGTFRLRNL